MKKVLLVVLCAALCLPLVFSVAAAIPEIDEAEKVDIVVVNRNDFDDVTEVNRSASPVNVNANNGFVALDNLDCTIENGALVINHSTKTSAMFDLQFKHIEGFPLIAQDAIFSMKIKPTSSNFSSGHPLDWGTDGNLLKVDNTLTISNCQLKIGGTVIGTLTVDEYAMLEWVFHYDTQNSKYSTVDILLNGAKVGEYTCVGLNGDITRIDFMRVMRYSNGSSVVDETTLALGTTSILYAKSVEESYNPDDYVPEIGESPIPVIPEADKVWMDIVANIDFNDMQAPLDDLALAQIARRGGFATLNNMNATVVDGELVVKSSSSSPDACFDLQFFQLENFPKIKEDVILSFKIKPLTTNLNVSELLCARFHTSDMDGGHSGIAGNNLRVEGREVGALPYGVYSLIEFAFHYDKDEAEYDTVDVLLNGVKVASYEVDATVPRVTHFRMFTYFNGEFAVDDIVLARGSTSLAYYSPDGKRPVVENPNNGNQNGGQSGGLTTSEPESTETTEPADVTTEAPATTDATQPAKTGCFSTVASAGVGVLMFVVGGAFLKKRKDDEI